MTTMNYTLFRLLYCSVWWLSEMLSLEANNLASALASSFWPRPRNSLASASRFWPRPRDIPEPSTDEPSKQLLRYITYINSDTLKNSSSELYCDFSVLQPLFDRLFCIPASSAPVERIFSQSSLIMTARRARMSNAVLESLLFLKCNADI